MLNTQRKLKLRRRVLETPSTGVDSGTQLKQPIAFIGPVIPPELSWKLDQSTPKKAINCKNFTKGKAPKKMHSPEASPVLGLKSRKLQESGSSKQTNPLAGAATKGMKGLLKDALRQSSYTEASGQARGETGARTDLQSVGNFGGSGGDGDRVCGGWKGRKIVSTPKCEYRSHDNSALNCSWSSWNSEEGELMSNVSTNYPTSDNDSFTAEPVEESEGNLTFSRCNLNDSRQFVVKEDGHTVQVEYVQDENVPVCEDVRRCQDVHGCEDVRRFVATENVGAGSVEKKFESKREYGGAFHVVYSQEGNEPKYVIDKGVSDDSCDESEDSCSASERVIEETCSGSGENLHRCALKVSSEHSCVLHRKTQRTQLQKSGSVLEAKPLTFVDTDEMYGKWTDGSNDSCHEADDRTGSLKSSNVSLSHDGLFKEPRSQTPFHSNALNHSRHFGNDKDSSESRHSSLDDGEKAWFERSDDDLDQSLPIDFKYLSQSPPPPPAFPPPFPTTAEYNFSPGHGFPRNQVMFWALDFYKRTVHSQPTARRPLHSAPEQPCPSPFYCQQSPSASDSSSLSQGSEVKERRWLTHFNNRFANCTFGYVDSHCHLDFLFRREGFRGTFAKYMNVHADLFPKCFEGCVAVFCEPSTFRANGGLWKDLMCEPNVWGTMGAHPKSATDFDAFAEDQLCMCIQHEKMMALGEIGLDYSGTFETTKERQKEVFVRQIKVAQAFDKPLVIHCRQAEDDCFEIMKQYVDSDHLIHRHCFTSDWAEAQRWLDTFPNLYLGLTSLITYRTAVDVQEVARNLPLDRLLLETDAPYFVPCWIPRDEMKLSHPGLAIYVADEVAKLQRRSLYDVLLACRKNTRRMYSV